MTTTFVTSYAVTSQSSVMSCICDADQAQTQRFLTTPSKMLEHRRLISGAVFTKSLSQMLGLN